MSSVRLSTACTKADVYRDKQWSFHRFRGDKLFETIGKTPEQCVEMQFALASVVDFQYIVDRGSYRSRGSRTKARPSARERASFVPASSTAPQKQKQVVTVSLFPILRMSNKVIDGCLRRACQRAHPPIEEITRSLVQQRT